ncbi:F-box/kelch-repeat protein [Raphanus sativus]|nr:F-box/kelch-repeat protein [Raphanus sativus]
MNLQLEPPEKKSKRKTSQPPSCPSFVLLPDEILLNCLARISRAYYWRLSIISKSFRSLLTSKELYAARSHLGSTEQCLYVCLSDESYQSPQWFTLCVNPNRTLTAGKSLALIPSSDFPSLSKSTLVVGSEIYVIGGPVKTEREANEYKSKWVTFKWACPSSTVRILDCRTHTWRDAPSMIVAQRHAHTYLYDGKIYVMGGCGVLDEPWGEVFDTNTQTWKPLSDPATEIRSCTFHIIKEIKGKIYFWTSDRTYAYDTSQDNWESIAQLEKSTCLMDVCCIPKSACIDGVWYVYSLTRDCQWTKDGVHWKGVKGLESLTKMYDRNGGLSGNTTELVSCGGKLLFMWEGYMKHNPCNRKQIWCAEIWKVIMKVRFGGMLSGLMLCKASP